ncbi:MAG: UvrD-helicase domain-containing protein, partial [Desulfobulbaceae bacterium]|nr:UvrD-helicase domain-containing protein [Desulfobulbaceae bacterium]
MHYLADLHIHSPFSRATSKTSNLAGLCAWARVKGIHLVGTGDFTHPGWLTQLKEQLVEAEPGFFKLRDENVPAAIDGITPAPIPTRFTLTAEVSSIYKRHGKVRKVHNILYAPDFAAVERINTVLAGIGNIEADGRPILGLDSRDLLEILLEQAPGGFMVPAHIWTPWFSLFGSKSGFDAIEECFGDLSDHIFALETGLSSDPAMNRLISALDRFTLISNSDCHSPSKLGREVNIFNSEFNFFAMREALQNPAKGFAGTVEFFPEEGKYHCDGHRKCAVCLEPEESRRLGDICPVCSRPLTVGVLHRVMELADRNEPLSPANAPTVESLIPLTEVLGEILGTGPASKAVMGQYGRLINLFGSEFGLLRSTPVADIGSRYSPVLAEAISRMRSGKVIRQPGYDGEFGVIKVFAEGELAELAGQTGLFGIARKQRPTRQKAEPLPTQTPAASTTPAPRAVNPEQQAAINSDAQKILVAAGPGTGKTFTLVQRIARLLTDPALAPETFAAITFTNRAAAEVRERLSNEAGPRAEQVFVGTLHRFCLEWLRCDQPDLAVIGEEERELLIKRLFPAADGQARNEIGRAVATYLATPSADRPQEPPSPEIARYLAELATLA